MKVRKGLAPISAKQAAALKPRAEAYREVLKITERCLGCGTTSYLTPSHVLSQKQFKQHRANKDNIVPLCQSCHDLWEHKKPQFRAKYPHAWDLKMHIMQELEPAYYLQFISKHSV